MSTHHSRAWWCGTNKASSVQDKVREAHLLAVDVACASLVSYWGMGLHNKASYAQDKVGEAHVLVVQYEPLVS